MIHPEDLTHRLARARFRAWHRGTREADYLFGGFFDERHAAWDGTELAWFEALLEEQDADVIAWAFKARQAPEKYTGKMLQALEKLDYVSI